MWIRSTEVPRRIRPTSSVSFPLRGDRYLSESPEIAYVLRAFLRSTSPLELLTTKKRADPKIRPSLGLPMVTLRLRLLLPRPRPRRPLRVLRPPQRRPTLRGWRYNRRGPSGSSPDPYHSRPTRTSSEDRIPRRPSARELGDQ